MSLFEETYKPWWKWGCILAPCLLPICWEYKVEITSSELVFGYSSDCLKRRVDRSRLQTVEKVDAINPCCEWGGYGVRKQYNAWDGGSAWFTGYIAKGGSGVHITYSDPETGKTMYYTFTCDDADRVVSILS